MSKDIQVLCLSQKGEVKQTKISTKQEITIESIKKLLKSKQDVDLCATYQYGNLFLFLFGAIDGKTGTENQHELPPPHDSILVFGDILLIASTDKTWKSPTHFTIAQYEKFYQAMFEGDDENASQDGDEDEDVVVDEDDQEEPVVEEKEEPVVEKKEETPPAIQDEEEEAPLQLEDTQEIPDRTKYIQDIQKTFKFPNEEYAEDTLDILETPRQSLSTMPNLKSKLIQLLGFLTKKENATPEVVNLTTLLAIKIDKDPIAGADEQIAKDLQNLIYPTAGESDT